MSEESSVFDPCKMAMHEEVKINADTIVMKVPGGWLYSKTSKSHILTTTFVPWTFLTRGRND